MPWAQDAPVIYEHFHRYLFASAVVEGRDVLDLASGEGYGSALLAATARSVLGVDIDPTTVEHSRLNYSAPNLAFEVGDARELGHRQAGSFGAIVAFEVIEHLAEHNQLLAGIEHVLAPDGILIISTPERSAYSEATGYQNPFHVQELTVEELSAKLRERFAHVAMWAQRTITGSVLLEAENEGTDTLQRFVMERLEGDWRLATGISPMFVVAVASNVELPRIPSGSILVDPGQELLQEAESARARAQASEQDARRNLAALEGELGAARAELATSIEKTKEIQQRDERTIAQLESELEAARQFRASVEGSVIWQLLQWIRRRVYSLLGGRDSRSGSLLQSVVRGVGRVLERLRH